MNIQDRDKQKFNGRQKQVSLQPKAIQMPLGNAVPKHKITINNKDRINNQLNDLFPGTDLDPAKENGYINEDFFMSLANNLSKMTAAKPENEEDDEEFEDERIPKEKIEGHILTGLVKDWKINYETFTNITKSQYAREIKRFIRFLIHKNVDNPTKEDAKEFIEHIIATKKPRDQQTCICSMESFFYWTDEKKTYENIVKGLKIVRYINGNKNKDFGKVIDTTELVDSQRPLRTALIAWINSLAKDARTKAEYRTEILNFILFLNSKRVEKPTYTNLMDYYTFGLTKKNAAAKENGLKIIHDFFDWAYKNNQYPENIFPGNGATPQQSIIVRQGEGKSIKGDQYQLQQDDAILISGMRKAGFNQGNVFSLLNNELKIFKDWITSSPQNVQFIVPLFKFAHFLYEGEKVITTPTQETIIDYYTKHLSQLDPNTINRHILPIKYFFQWTCDQQKVYPNIAINIVSIGPKPKKYKNIPILHGGTNLKDIPPANNPLIINIK